MEFLDTTGLTEIFQSKKINDLVDYGLGSVHDLAFHEASLHDELLGLIAILILAQDAGSGHGIFLVSKSDSGIALELLSQALQGGTLDSQTQHGDFIKYIPHPMKERNDI